MNKRRHCWTLQDVEQNPKIGTKTTSITGCGQKGSPQCSDAADGHGAGLHSGAGWQDPCSPYGGQARRIGNRRSELDGTRCVQPFAYAWAPLVLNKITFRAGRSKASRTPCAPDPARAPSNTAAGRASPASCCRRSVRTPAAKSLAPTLCGLEAPGAFRRTLLAAHAGESRHIECVEPVHMNDPRCLA